MSKPPRHPKDRGYGYLKACEYPEKHGVAYLNIGVYFELDLTDEQIDEVISELDYTIKHKLISDTRINGYEL